MTCSIKVAGVAAVMVIAGLGYQAGVPSWICASAITGLAATGGAWQHLQKRAVRWMPDDDFPRWMLANMAAASGDRKAD
ncbi:MAG: hypothetical protein AAF441_14965 [Pseudomonadota bacterium]